MSSTFQTVAALVVVALAASWLLFRALAKHRRSGCADSCACPSRELKR